MQDETRLDARQSAGKPFLILAIAIFCGEAAVMLVLDRLPRLSTVEEALLDASCLLAIVAPALYFFVFRPLSLHIAERQRAEAALRERSELLAALSARMLDAQESEKRRIAVELHERVAQTLAAVRLQVERAAATLRGRGDTTLPALDAAIAPLQSAIEDVRTVAVGLHPPTLDDLGLVAALRELCRNSSGTTATVRLADEADLADRDVPPSLAAIVFRVAESILAAAVADPEIVHVDVDLRGDHTSVALTVTCATTEGRPGQRQHEAPFADARDRTLLSGGRFSLELAPKGSFTLKAVWWR